MRKLEKGEGERERANAPGVRSDRLLQKKKVVVVERRRSGRSCKERRRRMR